MEFGGPPAALSLWEYAYKGDFNKLESLISHSGIEIDVLDGENRTPLHLAAAGGSASCITYLLERGANPNAKDCTGKKKNSNPFSLLKLTLTPHTPLTLHTPHSHLHSLTLPHYYSTHSHSHPHSHSHSYTHLHSHLFSHTYTHTPTLTYSNSHTSNSHSNSLTSNSHSNLFLHFSFNR
jgi:Ankyrin repeat